MRITPSVSGVFRWSGADNPDLHAGTGTAVFDHSKITVEHDGDGRERTETGRALHL